MTRSGAIDLEALVRKVQDGDSGAFEEVYRSLAGRIYALCLRMVGNSDEAEELTQDVFVRAWQRIDSFRGDSKFSTWLHRLAVNLVLQHRRSRARLAARETLVEDPARYEQAVRRSLPGTKIDIERAIAGLPSKAKRVLILRDIEGYKYKEIADLTGVTIGTVKAQVHRARKLVREAMER